MPGGRPRRDRPGDAEVDVVGMGDDHQHPLDAVVGRVFGDLHLRSASRRAVGSAPGDSRTLRGLHHLAHQEPALLLPQLVVTGCGIPRWPSAFAASTSSTSAPSAPSSLTWASPRSSTTARGRFGCRRHSASTSLARLRESVPSPTSPTSSASPSGGSGSTVGDKPGLVQVPEDLAGGPVRRRPCPARPPRPRPRRSRRGRDSR